MKTVSLEQSLKDALIAAEAAQQRASDLDEYSSLAEYSLLSTVLYDLEAYFGSNNMNSYQRERLIRMGFNPQ